MDRYRLFDLTEALVRTTLGAVGLEYVRYCLHLGNPVRRALAELPLDEGEVWTWVPHGVNVTAQYLRNGDGVSSAASRQLLADFVAAYLEMRDRVAFIEDFIAHPSDPWLSRALPPRLISASHVYWYVTTPDPSEVLDVVTNGSGPFMCMTLASLRFAWPPRAQEVEQQVTELARGAEHFIVDAYDLVGYVVWSRVHESL